MYIRKAKHDDLSVIMNIYHIAQDFMIASGNPNQWGHSYPSEDLILDDITNEVCHLIYDDECVHGVFALFDNIEPTYQYIEEEQWLNDKSYVTVHRIASAGKVHGIFKCVADYCKSISDNIRIDTHENNLIIQKQIEKNGFRKCGTICQRQISKNSLSVVKILKENWTFNI